MQHEVELVVEMLEPRRAAEAGEERRVHVERAGQEGEGALPERDAARAVQEEERPSLTGLEHLDGRAAGAEREEASLRRRGRHQAAAVRSAIRRAASLCVPGTTRSSLGSAFGQ